MLQRCTDPPQDWLPAATALALSVVRAHGAGAHRAWAHRARSNAAPGRGARPARRRRSRRRIPSVAATWSRRGGALGEGRPSAAELVRPCRSSARRGATVRWAPGSSGRPTTRRGDGHAMRSVLFAPGVESRAVRARACQPDAAVPGVALEVDDDAFRAVLDRNDIGWTEKED